jgi:hypothetical protein
VYTAAQNYAQDQPVNDRKTAWIYRMSLGEV